MISSVGNLESLSENCKVRFASPKRARRRWVYPVHVGFALSSVTELGYGDDDRRTQAADENVEVRVCEWASTKWHIRSEWAIQCPMIKMV